MEALDVDFRTGCTEATLGEAVEGGLDTGIATEAAGLAPGGGGRGAIPTPFLSLAAAAAAADAYFRVSPGNRVGSGAGFILPDVDDDAVFGWSVAKTGNGDFIWMDNLRGPDDSGFDFERASGSSSCTD